MAPSMVPRYHVGRYMFVNIILYYIYILCILIDNRIT